MAGKQTYKENVEILLNIGWHFILVSNPGIGDSVCCQTGTVETNVGQGTSYHKI